MPTVGQQSTTRDPLAPDNWVEVDRSADVSPGTVTNKKPSLMPKEGNWKEVKRNPADNSYVPQGLKGTDQEKSVDDVTQLLFSQGAKGFDTAVRLDHGELNWALQAFKGLSPDEAARVSQIAKDGNAAFPQVFANKEEWTQWDDALKIYNSLSEKDDKGRYMYPGTIQWIADPEKMAMAKDDVEALTEVEGLITRHRRPWLVQAGVTLKEETQRAFQNLIMAGVALSEKMGADQEKYPELDRILNGPNASERRAKFNAGLRKLVNSKFLSYEPLPRTEGFSFEQLTLDAVGIVPQVAGAVGAAVATESPYGAAAFMFPYIYGGSYKELTDAGVEVDRASIAAFANASVQSALESIGYGALFKFLGSVGTKGAGVVFRQYAEMLGTEWVTEFLQQFPDDATRIWGMAQQQNMDLGEQLQYFWENLPQTMQEGAYEGLITSFVSAVSGLKAAPSMIRQAQALDMNMRWWQNLDAAVQKSKLRMRAPEEFESLVDTTLNNSDAPSSIFVPYEALSLYFQGDDAQIERTAKELGVSDQLEDAQATGKDIEVKTSAWAKAVAGTDMALALQNDIRFEPDGMTMNERQNLQKDIQARLTEMRQEYDSLLEARAMPQEVYAMREQLMKPKKQGGFGMAAEDADAQLAVLMAGAETLSKERGETLQQWFTRINPVLKVGGKVTDSVNLVVENVSYQIDPDTAKSLNTPLELPADQVFTDAVNGTPGASITEDGLLIDLTRYQKEEQEGGMSIRTGVFYLPSGSPQEKYYKSGKIGYGGRVKIQGETLLRKPLFVKGATGGKAPEAAYDSIKGKGAYQKMRNDVLQATTQYGYKVQESDVMEVLEKYGADTSTAFEILYNSREGNTLPYAIQENIVAHAVREAGYDSVVGYSKKRGDSSFFISEVFDVREITYPTETGETEIHDKFFQDSKKVPRGSATEQSSSVLLQDNEDDSALIEEAKKYKTAEKFIKSYEGKLPTTDAPWVSKGEEADLSLKYLLSDVNSDIMQSRIGEEKIVSQEGHIVKTKGKYGGGRYLYVSGTGVTLAGLDFVGTKKDGFILSNILTFEPERGKGLATALLNSIKADKKKLKVDSHFTEDGAAFFSIKTLDQLTTIWNKAHGKVLEQKEGAAPRGSVEFGDTQTVISLYKTANFSTLLHETGHIFATEMKSLIDAGQASEQLAKDYQALVDAYGDLSKRKGQENFARAFEAYLREGKAPSVKLVEAFRKFRAWLTAIYKSLKGLNVEINDDVRGVFDRLLASEQEISEVQDYYSFKKSIVDLMPAVDEKRRADVKEKQQKTADQAMDQQVARYMKAYLDAIGGKSVIRDLASREYDALKAVKAINQAKEKGGLDATSIEAQYGTEALNTLKDRYKGLIKKKSDLSLGELAATLEYESEQQLLNELLALPSKQDAVNKRTEELLQEREKEIRDELGKAQTVAGEAAYHNDSHLSFLIAEAEVLAGAIEQAQGRQARRIEAKIIKDAARDIILAKKASQAIRYDAYSRAEQKYAKQALAFTEAGDFAQAFDAKKRQLLNHALVAESIRARDVYQAIQDRYSASNIKSMTKSVENAFSEYALDLIQQYGLSSHKGVGPAKAASIQQLYELDDFLAGQTPEWIQQRRKPENFGSYRDLTMQQLVELDQSIKSILHAGRDVLTSIEEGNIKTVDELAQASIADMDALADKKIYNEFSKKGQFLNKIDGVVSQAVMTEFLFDRLDGYSFSKGNGFGPLRRMFNRGVKAETEYAQLKEDTLKTATPHWDTLYQAKKRLEQRFGGKEFQIEGVPVTQDMKKLGRDGWTAERVISFVLNMGNEGNITALANSYGYHILQMQRIASLLTASELQAIQGIWDATNTLFPKLDKVNFRIYNRHLDKVPARELLVQSADGQQVKLPGGYYPLMFDHALSDRAGAIKEAQDDIMKNRNTAVFRSTKPTDGMTYSRTPGHSLPPELSLRVWFTHVADTARYISHAEVLRDMNRLTQHKDWKDKVRDKAGREAYSHLRKWLSYQARPERYVHGNLDRLVDWQRRLATVAILGLNLGVGAKQRLSMFSAVQELGGWGDIKQAYGQLDLKGSVLGLESSEMWQKIEEVSPYMKTRMNNIDREIHDTVDKFKPDVQKFNILGKEFTSKDVQNFAFEWIRLNDRATVGVVWTAAFNKAMREKNSDPSMTDNERLMYARDAADAIVRTTQPSALPIDLNDLQRSEGMMRLFTSFMTWTFKAGNRFIAKAQMYKDGEMSTSEYVRHVLYEYVAPAWGAAIISSLLVDGDLPEWSDWLLSPAGTAISWIPIVRDIPAAIKYKQPLGTTPAFEGMDRMVKAAVTTGQFMVGKKEFYQVLWDVSRAIEMQLGIPATNMIRDVDRIYKHATGQED